MHPLPRSEIRWRGMRACRLAFLSRATLRLPRVSQHVAASHLSSRKFVALRVNTSALSAHLLLGRTARGACLRHIHDRSTAVLDRQGGRPAAPRPSGRTP
jgi:hypothetical protein